MLVTLLEGLLVWLLVAFVFACALGSFLRACAAYQLEQSEAARAVPPHSAHVLRRA
jgi:hypothetical protein